MKNRVLSANFATSKAVNSASFDNWNRVFKNLNFENGQIRMFGIEYF